MPACPACSCPLAGCPPARPAVCAAVPCSKSGCSIRHRTTHTPSELSQNQPLTPRRCAPIWRRDSDCMCKRTSPSNAQTSHECKAFAPTHRHMNVYLCTHFDFASLACGQCLIRLNRILLQLRETTKHIGQVLICMLRKQFWLLF